MPVDPAALRTLGDGRPELLAAEPLEISFHLYWANPGYYYASDEFSGEATIGG